MFSRLFRPAVLRPATRAFPAVRAFSDAPAATKVKLNFSLPGESLYTAKDVDLVLIPGVDGVFGIMANHVPTIAEMKPGVIVIEDEGESKKFFVSGGFAFMHPDSTLDLNAMEACNIEDLDPAAVQAGLTEYTAAAQSTDEYAKAEAEIGLECFTAMNYAIADGA